MTKMTAKDKNMTFDNQMSPTGEGDEFLTGSNNNADYLSRRLAAMGVSTDTQEFDDGEMDLELCDLSESEYDYSYDEEEDEENERGNDEGKPGNERTPSKSQQMLQNGSKYDMDLVPYGDGEEEIDSEEERDLLKEIREEIQNKVKEEMKEEIQVYKAKIAAIEQGEIPGDEERKEKKEEEEENLDPKIQEALMKMRKLDRILMKKMKREKEVKRDRILLERRIREEIQNIKPEGREHKDVKCNTDKFVALALPPSHNEGVPVEPPPATPVFQTQLNEADFQDMTEKANRKMRTENDETGLKSESSSTMGDNSSRLGDTDGKKRKKKKKDFIKRNKELAANADDTIAMTEEERKRVGDLLNDLDSLAELPEEMEGANGDADNPFKMMAVTPGQGYSGDQTQIMSMAHIDGRLRELLPDDEYEALVSTPQESFRDPQHKLFTHVNIRSVGDIERYGDRALLENKEQREMQERLQRIEEQLARFHNPEEIEIETPQLTEDAMKGLIDQCVRSLSRSSYADSSTVNEATPRSEVSSVVSLLENPPHLPDDVLQKLLAEAHFPLSSRLEALWEEEEKKEEESGEEGNGRSEQISAETWKVIAESDVYDNEQSNDLDLESISRSSSRSTLRSSSSVDRQNFDPSRPSMESVENRLILPEINQSPFLVSQGMNNYLSKNETNFRRNQDSNRDSINMVRNNLAEANGDSFGTERDSFDTVTPRPPSTDRRSNTDYSSRSRTVTPLS